MRPLVVVLSLGLLSCQSRSEPTASPSAPAKANTAAVSSAGAPPPAGSVSVRAAVPPRDLVTCVLEGQFAIRANEKLLLGEMADVEARFTGHRVYMRVDHIDTAKGPVASGVVRAPATPPSLRLDARFRVDALPIHAARDIRVVGEQVVIPRGTALVLTSGEGSALGVKPRYGDFDGVTARASCDDVMLGDATPQPRAPKTGTDMHVAPKRAALFAAPDGASLIELVTRREGPTVEVMESRGAFRLIRYDDGVRIDGWMRASDLAPGAGADCDDCHGAIMDVDDVCPPPKGCPDEKGGPFHARRKVAVRDRPSPEGRPLGWLEEDGEVRIVGHKGTYARVEPVTGEIAAPTGGFWIDEATLDPRKK